MIRDLKTSIWVSALIKRAEIGGAFAHIVHKGDVDFGSVLIKIVISRSQLKLLAPSRNQKGDLIWVDLTNQITKSEEFSNEIAIDNYLQKRISQDRDLWIVEIEDTKGRDFLIERVE
jgi:hypothetical protein